jgi:hypothetical protein
MHVIKLLIEYIHQKQEDEYRTAEVYLRNNVWFASLLCNNLRGGEMLFEIQEAHGPHRSPE